MDSGDSRFCLCFVLFFDESRFNVSLTARDKVTRQCTHATIAEETKAEAESNRVPSAYQPERVLLFVCFLFVCLFVCFVCLFVVVVVVVFNRKAKPGHRRWKFTVSGSFVPGSHRLTFPFADESSFLW